MTLFWAVLAAVTEEPLMTIVFDLSAAGSIEVRWETLHRALRRRRELVERHWQRPAARAHVCSQ